MENEKMIFSSVRLDFLLYPGDSGTPIESNQSVWRPFLLAKKESEALTASDPLYSLHIFSAAARIAFKNFQETESTSSKRGFL